MVYYRTAGGPPIVRVLGAIDMENERAHFFSEVMLLLLLLCVTLLLGHITHITTHFSLMAQQAMYHRSYYSTDCSIDYRSHNNTYLLVPAQNHSHKSSLLFAETSDQVLYCV
mmetsp:Transcript_31409/g.33749  ORF Transcript_31409/g.33749 Transcript_31409/m.33749 type:complete len:112 (-) Transcript_31409:351-686(-)